MLSPKRTKYRKCHRPSFKGIATKGTTMAFGDFGLQALESAWVTSRQIEAGRRAMTRYARRGGKLWIRIFSILIECFLHYKCVHSVSLLIYFMFLLPSTTPCRFNLNNCHMLGYWFKI